MTRTRGSRSGSAGTAGSRSIRRPGAGGLAGTYSSTSLGFNAQSAQKLLAARRARGSRVRTRRRVRCARPRLRAPESTLDRRPAARDRQSRDARAEEALAKPSVLPVSARERRGRGHRPPEDGAAEGFVTSRVIRGRSRSRVRASSRSFFMTSGCPPTRLRPSTSWAAPCPRGWGSTRAASRARRPPHGTDRPTQASTAAAAARNELRDLKRRLRRSLATFDRARGLFSVRSLGLG